MTATNLTFNASVLDWGPREPSCIEWCAVELENVLIPLQYNDLWIMYIVLCGAVLYTILIDSNIKHKWYVDRFFLYSIIIGVLVFIIRNFP